MPISVRFNLSLFLLPSCQVGINQTGQLSTCDPVKDSLELVKFYNTFNGDTWNNKMNWLSPGMPIETWYGVNIHADGCVQSIYLSANNPTGEIYEPDFPERGILYIPVGQT